MNCEQARPLLSPLLDEALPPSQAAQALAHVQTCASCGAEADALKRASRLVRELPLRPLPPGFMARLAERRRGNAVESAWSGAGRPLAFVAAAVVCGLVVAGPWRSRRLARAPGEPLDTPALPSLKLGEEPPPPPAPVTADAAVAPAPEANKAGGAGGRPYGSAPAYTNEQLHQALQEESARLGIHAARRQAPPAPEAFLGPKLGQPGVRERGEAVSRQLAALRQAVDEAAGKRTVPVNGSVAPVLRRGAADAEAGGLADGRALQDGFWSGDYGAGNEGTRTIEDAPAWAALWKTLSGGPPPAVDFTKERLIAVFLGARPTGGYSVEFVDVVKTPSRVVVRWREHEPAVGAGPEGATAPYAIKAVTRTDLPVRFEKVR